MVSCREKKQILIPERSNEYKIFAVIKKSDKRSIKSYILNNGIMLKLNLKKMLNSIFDQMWHVA